MGMSKAIDVAPRVLVLAVVTFALALALLVLAQPASAVPGSAPTTTVAPPVSRGIRTIHSRSVR